MPQLENLEFITIYLFFINTYIDITIFFCKTSRDQTFGIDHRTEMKTKIHQFHNKRHTHVGYQPKRKHKIFQ